MKKNKMMRVASALLVAVLLSTCAISGTFAKYVTTESGSDSARVAKWGVVIDADNFNLFTDKYETDDTNATFTGDYSVKSADGKDVFAPGTSGTFAKFSISGTPEVAVDVEVVPTVAVSGDWIVAGDFYCPIVITVGTTAICGLTFDNASDFADAVADAIEGYSKQYAPNEDLSAIDANFGISWEWAFEDADHVALDHGCTAGAQTDAKDTALGDKAVAGDLKIDIGVKITVTQID